MKEFEKNVLDIGHYYDYIRWHIHQVFNGMLKNYSSPSDFESNLKGYRPDHYSDESVKRLVR